MYLLAVALAHAESPPLDDVCAWDDAAWLHYAALYVQGTTAPFAQSYARTEHRVLVSADLGFDPWGARFRGTFAGQGLTVYADVDVNEAGIFQLTGGNAAAGPAILLDGAELSIVGRAGDGVRAGPGRWTTEEFAPQVDASVAIPCSRVTLSWLRSNEDDAARIAAAGLPTPAGVRAPVRRGKIKVRDAPDGAIVGILTKQSYERTVYVLEEREGWTRFALPHWQGTVWHGWTDAELRAPEEGMGGLGMGGLAGSPPKIEVRRCAEDVPLYGGPAVGMVQVGVVSPAATFRLLAERGEHVAVDFPGAWLSVPEGGELWMPAAAAACPIVP